MIWYRHWSNETRQLENMLRQAPRKNIVEPFCWALTGHAQQREFDPGTEWSTILDLVVIYCIRHVTNESLDARLPFPPLSRIEAVMEHLRGSVEFQPMQLHQLTQLETQHQPSLQPQLLAYAPTKPAGVDEQNRESGIVEAASGQQSFEQQQTIQHIEQIGETAVASSNDQVQQANPVLVPEKTRNAQADGGSEDSLFIPESRVGDIEDQTEEEDISIAFSGDTDEDAIGSGNIDTGEIEAACSAGQEPDTNTTDDRASDTSAHATADASVPPRYHHLEPITPAGPEALNVICCKVSRLLLLRLPPLQEMKFKRQTFISEALPVCLLIGVYGPSNALRRGQRVWAYVLPQPNRNRRYAAPIEMYVKEQDSPSSHQKSVTWSKLKESSIN